MCVCAHVRVLLFLPSAACCCFLLLVAVLVCCWCRGYLIQLLLFIHMFGQVSLTSIRRFLCTFTSQSAFCKDLVQLCIRSLRRWHENLVASRPGSTNACHTGRQSPFKGPVPCARPGEAKRQLNLCLLPPPQATQISSTTLACATRCRGANPAPLCKWRTAGTQRRSER